MKNSNIFRWPGKQGLTPDLEIENFEELSSHATSVVLHKAIFYMTEILTFGNVLFANQLKTSDRKSSTG